MRLKMEQIQQYILLAYQSNKAKNNVTVEYRKDTKGDLCVLFYEHSDGIAKGIDIFNYQSDKDDRYELIIAILNGEKSLFDETPVQRDSRTTSEIF